LGWASAAFPWIESGIPCYTQTHAQATAQQCSNQYLLQSLVCPVPLVLQPSLVSLARIANGSLCLIDRNDPRGDGVNHNTRASVLNSRQVTRQCRGFIWHVAHSRRLSKRNRPPAIVPAHELSISSLSYDISLMDMSYVL
jgi:hypothetical protein